MAADGDGGPVVKTLTAVFGLFAGVASVVYIGGGLIVYLRLHYLHLPTPLDVTGRLAKEVLISVGLSVILAPLLVFALLYTTLRFIRGAAQPRRFPVLHADPMPIPPGAPPDQVPPDRWEWHERWASPFAWAIIGFVLTIPGMVVWSLTHRQDLPWTLWLVGFLASTLMVTAIVHVRHMLVRRYDSLESFNALNVVVLFGFMWALVLLPGCIVFGAGAQPQSVRVCRAGTASIGGFFLGETDSRVYVGEAKIGERRLVAIPWDGTEGVFVGSPNNPGLCDLVRPSPTPTATSTTTPSP